MCVSLLINQMPILSLMGISVPASVMGHAPVYGVHPDDSPLGSSCAQPGGLSSGRRRQDKAEDLGTGGPQAGTGESLTKHR